MAPPFISLEKRFWSKVEKTETCWNWTAGLGGKGYGKIRLPGKKGGQTQAHRVSWFLAHGYFSPVHVLHHCDNKRCVRPEHLFEGTNQDNVDDKVAKGRQYNIRDEGGRFARSEP